jgi:hypothetical protein
LGTVSTAVATAWIDRATAIAVRRKRLLAKRPGPATGIMGKWSMDVLLITVVAVVALALLF